MRGGDGSHPRIGRCGRLFALSARRLPAVAPSIVPSLPRMRTRGGGDAVTTEVDPAGVRYTGVNHESDRECRGDRSCWWILSPKASLVGS